MDSATLLEPADGSDGQPAAVPPAGTQPQARPTVDPTESAPENTSDTDTVPAQDAQDAAQALRRVVDDSESSSALPHLSEAMQSDTADAIPKESDGSAAGAASGEDDAGGARGDAMDVESPAVEHTAETDEAAGRDEDTAQELKGQGNDLFKAGRLDEALALYDEAAAVAPLRPECAGKLAAIHANRAACLLGLERHEECIAACDECLDLDPRYVKAMLRRVKALEKLDMFDEAQQDYEDILAEFPGNAAAKSGLERLRTAQKEKEEKLKTEMLDKLKGVGNSLLGHFGLSLDNFKMEQDPKTGGYSINFQQGGAAGTAGEPTPDSAQPPTA